MNYIQVILFTHTWLHVQDTKLDNTTAPDYTLCMFMSDLLCMYNAQVYVPVDRPTESTWGGVVKVSVACGHNLDYPREYD